MVATLRPDMCEYAFKYLASSTTCSGDKGIHSCRSPYIPAVHQPFWIGGGFICAEEIWSSWMTAETAIWKKWHTFWLVNTCVTLQQHALRFKSCWWRCRSMCYVPQPLLHIYRLGLKDAWYVSGGDLESIVGIFTWMMTDTTSPISIRLWNMHHAL